MKFANILKKQNGITGIDISISILIITVFTGILAALFYNIYITSMNIERSDIATNIAINIIEYANKINYDEIDIETFDEDKLLLKYQDQDENGVAEKHIPNGYECKIEVTPYATSENELEDIIKTITVKIKYKIGKGDHEIAIQTLKVKEQ